MAFFNIKERRLQPQPIPPTPPYVPPVVPTPPEAEEGSTPVIPRDTFTGNTELHLYKISDENNKLTKTFKAHHTFTTSLKNDVSVINPEITLNTEYDLTQYNYAYIEATQRYYFIDNVEMLPGNIFRISMHVDVLMSFNEGIKNMNAILVRSEDERYINEDINDGTFVNMEGVFIEIKKFSGTGFSKTTTNILIADGG